MSWHRIAADSRRSSGFALLEVLVAVAVSAVLMTALMRSFTTTWLGVNAVREEAESMLVARAMLTAAAPRINTAEGEQTGTLGRYAWRIAVTKPLAEAALLSSPNAAAPPGDNETPELAWTLYRVVITIKAPSGRSTSLETFRLSKPAG